MQLVAVLILLTRISMTVSQALGLAPTVAAEGVALVIGDARQDRVIGRMIRAPLLGGTGGGSPVRGVRSIEIDHALKVIPDRATLACPDQQVCQLHPGPPVPMSNHLVHDSAEPGTGTDARAVAKRVAQVPGVAAAIPELELGDAQRAVRCCRWLAAKEYSDYRNASAMSCCRWQSSCGGGRVTTVTELKASFSLVLSRSTSSQPTPCHC